MSSPYVDVGRFPFLQPLVAEWQTIRDESLRITADDLTPYPVSRFYDGTWQVCGLRAPSYPGHPKGTFEPLLERNRRKFARTFALASALPGNETLGFSLLSPGCEIHMHDHPEGMFIVHLGLRIPEAAEGQCAIEVRGQRRAWRPGEAFVFHETERHRAWNRSAETRVVLLADFSAAPL